MSSLLRQCAPSTSRILHPARTFSISRPSNAPQNTDDEVDRTPKPLKPSYLLPDPIFDNETEYHFQPTVRAPTRPGSLVRESNWEPMFFDIPALLRNPESVFRKDDDDFADFADTPPGGRRTGEQDMSPLRHLLVPFDKLGSLHRYPLLIRRVVQQTGKGKIQSMYSLIVVGNGDGLVGIGEGKADALQAAADKAFAQAVRNMDFVDRFENRTLWTDIDTKFGATRILMRPRPVGFGLACAPAIHQVLKAAGIKDCSAKVWGSRNPLNVIKATIRVLHAGHAPLGMGDGVGGQGRRLEAGSGVRGKAAIERERGRVVATGRTW